jgi:hypothetical protein
MPVLISNKECRLFFGCCFSPGIFFNGTHPMRDNFKFILYRWRNLILDIHIYVQLIYLAHKSTFTSIYIGLKNL